MLSLDLAMPSLELDDYRFKFDDVKFGPEQPMPDLNSTTLSLDLAMPS